MADQIPDSAKSEARELLAKAYADNGDLGAARYIRGGFDLYPDTRIALLAICDALATRAAPPAMDREAVYRQALGDVCNPLGYLQRMAEAEGAELSGMAYAIASDIGTIQRIAKRALSTLSADAIRQGEGWQPISDADTSQERLTVLGYGTFRGSSHPQVVVLDWVKWIGSWSAYTMTFEPTHWMPLPATPASHASDGGKA